MMTGIPRSMRSNVLRQLQTVEARHVDARREVWTAALDGRKSALSARRSLDEVLPFIQLRKALRTRSLRGHRRRSGCVLAEDSSPGARAGRFHSRRDGLPRAETP